MAGLQELFANKNVKNQFEGHHAESEFETHFKCLYTINSQTY